MKHILTDQWDETLWAKAKPVYEAAFPEHGRKKDAIVKRMFERKLCELHVWLDDIGSEAAAMALTAADPNAGVLVIDYFAVRRENRGQGIGMACMADMRRWAEHVKKCRGIVIEAEADDSADNANRMRFWVKAGFKPTDYVHAYIWVPETYRALALSLDASNPLPEDGEQLFKPILRYHEKAYRR
ncbi:GNAT family N-acetyltransferase [Paenibacillus protaetiae]|uniref:N-acetyltransferase n=1 Tax=Paenibacillus protaetiae TaxID=2509456 RepID=A0A4P6ETS0_9BACL|nr:GNAT family N-acetyltransferase [Paenibacillus protaetiae]QAY65855.1 N-acetyltransferase [Paenibacillus protaetiae]